MAKNFLLGFSFNLTLSYWLHTALRPQQLGWEKDERTPHVQSARNCLMSPTVHCRQFGPLSAPLAFSSGDAIVEVVFGRKVMAFVV